MNTEQPEALRREYRATMPHEIMHLWAVDALACIASLEAQLEAIGAGGISPLIAGAGFDAADMATASAQGFRGGAASVDVAQERPTPEHIEAMQRAWLWMENQAEAQSKGSHATFDLMMLRDERDALRAAIDAARKQGANHDR